MTRHEVFSVRPLAGKAEEIISESYDIHYGVGAERQGEIERYGENIRVLITSGGMGLTAEEMSFMPSLGLVCATGAGFDKIDVDTATSKGVVVTNSPAANAPSVADHALGLMLALAREIVMRDRVVRAGGWRSNDAEPNQITGRRLGVLGLGRIGERVAKRASGFDMPVTYHNRHRRTDVDYEWKESVVALAEASDFLVVAAPGGPATKGLVDRQVLDALGPQGFLVNVGRGAIVNTPDLIAALKEGAIAGAGLDVIDSEPEVPQELKEMDNVVLTPHVGGLSPESMDAKIRLMVHNIDMFFAGERPPSAVN